MIIPFVMQSIKPGYFSKAISESDDEKKHSWPTGINR